MRRINSGLLALLTAQYAIEGGAATLCSPDTKLPAVKYTISPQFIWFPALASASQIAAQLKASIETANPSEGTIKSSIPNFLNTECTLHLSIRPTKYASTEQSISLLNETLASTDLLCRLATHKLGRTYTEDAHIMLPSKLAASIQLPVTKRFAPPIPEPILPRIDPLRRMKSKRSASESNIDQVSNVDTVPPFPDPPIPPVDPPRRRDMRQFSTFPDQNQVSDAAGFEYTVQCPPTADVTSDSMPLEGLKGLAMMKDCEWCSRTLGEMQGMCGLDVNMVKGIGHLAGFVKEMGWSYGGGICETC